MIFDPTEMRLICWHAIEQFCGDNISFYIMTITAVITMINTIYYIYKWSKWKVFYCEHENEKWKIKSQTEYVFNS